MTNVPAPPNATGFSIDWAESEIECGPDRLEYDIKIDVNYGPASMPFYLEGEYERPHRVEEPSVRHDMKRLMRYVFSLLNFKDGCPFVAKFKSKYY